MSSEQSWWQTLPGVLTATAGVLTAITALVAALNQSGLLKARETAAQATAPQSVSAPLVKAEPSSPPNDAGGVTRKPSQPTTVALPAAPAQVLETPARPAATDTPQRLGALDDKALLAELQRANVGFSVSEGTMLGWLADEDKTFRRIGRASARLLNGHRIRPNAPDLDVIKYHYLQRTTGNGDGVLEADARIDDNQLRQAIIAAFNDKNGTSARRLEGIFDDR